MSNTPNKFKLGEVMFYSPRKGNFVTIDTADNYEMNDYLKFINQKTPGLKLKSITPINYKNYKIERTKQHMLEQTNKLPDLCSSQFR